MTNYTQYSVEPKIHGHPMNPSVKIAAALVAAFMIASPAIAKGKSGGSHSHSTNIHLHAPQSRPEKVTPGYSSPQNTTPTFTSTVGGIAVAAAEEPAPGHAAGHTATPLAAISDTSEKNRAPFLPISRRRPQPLPAVREIRSG